MSGVTKYGPKGLYSIESFPSLASYPLLAKSLSSLANHSLTRSTWSSYTTAEKMLQTCCTDTERTLSYPLEQDDILFFIGWLNNRGLSSSTISCYISALRQVHLSKGVQPPLLCTDLVNQILAGKKHIDNTERKIGPVRIPVTPTLLRILKLQISLDPTICQHDRVLLWFVCSLAFHGSFRMGELLSRKTLIFDPNYSLLQRDVRCKGTEINGIKVNFIQISLKSTKTSATTTTVVDVFSTNNDICPFKAYTKWSKVITETPSLPAFQLRSGKLLTGTFLNKKLKFWLADYLDFSKTSVSGHSFRAGLVSVLGSLGFEDHNLKTIGRWSSRAFELYTKLPRTKRLAMAKAMGDLNI